MHFLSPSLAEPQNGERQSEAMKSRWRSVGESLVLSYFLKLPTTRGQGLDS